MRSSSSTPAAGPQWARWWDQPYALLIFTTLVWGANAVAARLAVGEVSPMLLTLLRWVVCCVALAGSARHEILAHWRSLRPRWLYVLWMGGLGYTGFNALYYLAAHHTSAINLAILQGTIPVMVLVGSVFLFGRRIGPMQALGVAVTLAGIIVVASQGQFARLAGLEFNVGDAWMIVACVFYTAFALGLPSRPAVPAIAFFAATALVACLVSIPLVAFEWAAGDLQWPSWRGVALVVFIGLLPSFISQVTFIRAVALIGPARAGLFLNLVPIFGPLQAVLILGEPLGWHHALALALVLGGIFIAEHFGPRPQGATR